MPTDPPRKVAAPRGKPSGKQLMGLDTKWWVIGGGAAVIAAWYVYKKRAATSTSAADPSIDPGTGVPYADEYSGMPGGSTAGGGATAGTPYAATGMPDPTSGVPTTNASWIALAEASLIGMGYSPDQVSAALSKYVNGQPLTSNEHGTVSTALGSVGHPPTSPTALKHALQYRKKVAAVKRPVVKPRLIAPISIRRPIVNPVVRPV